jgi:hypothetical protein
MAKKRLTSRQYRDEVIRRQIQVARYATGQTEYVRSLIDKLNEKIARYCLKEDLIETKGQYAECKKYIKARSIEYREKLYKYLQKELKDFIIEQSKWVYANSPVKLKKVNIDRIMKDIFFTAYSDTDDIKGYVTRIFNQIFQIWNAQLTIAYRARQSMKDMIKLVLDKDFGSKK